MFERAQPPRPSYAGVFVGRSVACRHFKRLRQRPEGVVQTQVIALLQQRLVFLSNLTLLVIKKRKKHTQRQNRVQPCFTFIDIANTSTKRFHAFDNRQECNLCITNVTDCTTMVPAVEYLQKFFSCLKERLIKRLQNIKLLEAKDKE